MPSSTTRRGFFGGAALASLGVVWPGKLQAAALQGPFPVGGPADPQEVSPEARLRQLGIELPPAPRPVATYVPAVVVGNVLFVAGHTPRMPDGSPGFVGRVGAELTLEQGREAARTAGLNVLATLRGALGTLDRVVRLARTFGMVNAPAGFTDHPQVINGFSDLMVEVFGESAGQGTRAAVGMGSLPAGMGVEIETFWEIRT